MTRQSRIRNVSLRSSLGLAALLVATIVGIPAAQASVVYSGSRNIAIPVTIDGVYLNVVTGVTGGSASAVPGNDLNLWGYNNLFVWANETFAPIDGGIVSGFGGNTTAIDNLAPGTIVAAADGLTYHPTNASVEQGTYAFNLNSSNNYVGFSFYNEATSALDYGWLQFELGASFTDGGRAILGWAYDDSGANIAVGATTNAVTQGVPEPDAALLLASGALGVGLVRRRR